MDSALDEENRSAPIPAWLYDGCPYKVVRLTYHPIS